jgi:hypothetical protein
MPRLLLVLSLVVVASSSGVAQTLKGDEIKAAVSGKSGTWQGATGNGGTIHYHADGKSQLTGKFPGFTEDTGGWRISGDKFCNRWKKIRNGKEACFHLKRLPDGSLDTGFSVIKLN